MGRKDNLYFALFSNCIPVKGAKRSIVCDLQLGRYRFIPNLMFDILKHSGKNTVLELKKKYNHSFDLGIDKYFKLLSQDNWGFFTDSPNAFPPLKMDWDSPSLITNAIFDFDKSSNYNWKKGILELNSLQCEAIQLRYFGKSNIKFVNAILQEISNTDIAYVEIQLQEAYGQEAYIDLLKRYPRVRQIAVVGSCTEEIVDLATHGFGKIIFTKKIITSESHCGVVEPSYFEVNISHFTEAKAYNSCLNRKIGIDKSGHIRNCPSMKTTYGHIDSTSILSVIKLDAYQELWHINKDQITTCKACEFRYICTDCRAYITNETDVYSKPSKCNYNPFSET